nr:glutathione S-transferase family protein [uncultured Roseococcus sp.]
MKLYLSPGSSSMAAHIALREVGAEFTTASLSFDRGETRTPEFLAINPLGKVPTLIVDGRPLTEVAGILFYLGRRFPEAKLLPEDIEGQAQVVSWMSFCASTVHPARRQGLEHSLEIYHVVERKLAGREWCVGAYSVADIHLFRLYWRVRDWLDQPAGTFPALEAHYARMMARDAVRETIEAEKRLG